MHAKSAPLLPLLLILLLGATAPAQELKPRPADQPAAPPAPAEGPAASSSAPVAAPAASADSVPAGAILRISMEHPFSLNKLKAGDTLEGGVAEAVYVYDREVVPAGSHVQLVVEEVSKQRVRQEKKGFVERLDSARSLGLDRQYAYAVAFRSATVALPGSAPVPLHCSFIQGGQVVELHAKGDEIRVGETTGSILARKAPGVSNVENVKQGKKQFDVYRHPMLTVKLDEAANFERPGSPPAVDAAPAGQAVELPAGTHARLLLLSGLTASAAKPGDVFEARLLQPIVDNGRLVLPEGTTFEGEVRRVVHPRRLSRPASLYLTFDKLTLPGGASQKIAASLAGTDVAKDAPVKMDAEGGLHGGNRGVKRTLEDLGLGLAAHQVADEAVELAVHAVAPYAGAATGMFFFLGGRGKDVTLPQYSELQIVFNRAVEVPAKTGPQPPAAAAQAPAAPPAAPAPPASPPQR